MRANMEKLGIRHLEITKHLANMDSEESLKRLLMGATKAIVRVYCISAYDLSSRDNGSDSDPYLLVSLGKKVYNDRDNYIEDEPNPNFFKSFDFEATFPGCPMLKVAAYDYDEIFGDDVIGETLIDLEDRFFSPEWQSVKNKPIEYRQLFYSASAMSQGTIKLWVEIHPTSIPMDEVPLWDITPKPPQEMEVRVAVMDTVDVICMDAEGTSDVYIRCFFDSKDDRETDTHFRCQNGKASFNYRLLFPITYPKSDWTFTVQMYDRDFFKSNDIIGEAAIDLGPVIEDCALTNRQMSINKTYYN